MHLNELMVKTTMSSLPPLVVRIFWQHPALKMAKLRRVARKKTPATPRLRRHRLRAELSTAFTLARLGVHNKLKRLGCTVLASIPRAP
jgi:hypothetical protein